MWISSQTVFFSNALRRRLIHGSSIFKFVKKTLCASNKPNVYDPERLLELLSNRSIKPFLNVDRSNLLRQFYKQQKDETNTYTFVIDDDVAKDIVDKIVTSDTQKKGILVEVNPGLGLITINLVNSSVSRIVVFDQSEIQDVALAQLISAYPEKIIRKKGNMHNSPEVLLSSVDMRQQYGLPVTLIGVATSFYFLKGLVLDFIKYQLWPEKFQVFLVISTNVLNGIKGCRLQAFKFHFYCMFHLLYTIEEIAKYPRDAFLPLSSSNTEDMLLVRISLNPNSLNVLNMEEVNEYLTFLKVLGKKIKNFVIPTVEHWVPNCGPYLISKGVSMTTQVNDLSYEEAFRLFIFLKGYKGYSDLKPFHDLTRNM